MAEAVGPAHRVAATVERPSVETADRGLPAADRGGWTLMLVPATICLAMFVVAFWW
ncbi:MAG TPA: hypothetical protein VIT65_02565 [Microlunatus sp.]